MCNFQEDAIPGLDTLLTVIQIDEQSSPFISLIMLLRLILLQIANELYRELKSVHIVSQKDFEPF